MDVSLGFFARYGFDSVLVSIRLIRKILKISDFYLTSLQLVLCRVAAVKRLPRTSTIVQFIFYFGPLRSAIIF